MAVILYGIDTAFYRENDLFSHIIPSSRRLLNFSHKVSRSQRLSRPSAGRVERSLQLVASLTHRILPRSQTSLRDGVHVRPTRHQHPRELDVPLPRLSQRTMQ